MRRGQWIDGRLGGRPVCRECSEFLVGKPAVKHADKSMLCAWCNKQYYEKIFSKGLMNPRELTNSGFLAPDLIKK